MFGWLHRKKPQVVETPSWKFSFSVSDEGFKKPTAAKLAELERTVNLLGILVRDCGFKKIEEFGSTWPKCARILKDVTDADGEADTLWIEVYVEVSGEEHDRVGNIRWSANYQYGDDLFLEVTIRRAEKALKEQFGYDLSSLDKV